MNIFILEDLPVRVNKFKELLNVEGIRLVFADTVVAAKEALTKEKFDCIFLDHDLGGKSFVDSNDPNTGYQLAKWIAEKKISFQQIFIQSLNTMGAQNIKAALPTALQVPFLSSVFKNVVDQLLTYNATETKVPSASTGAYAEKTIYEQHKKNGRKIADVLRTFKEPKKVLIAFYHGIGDLLMFLPLFEHIRRLFHPHTFDLAIIPGVGQKEIVPWALEIAEKKDFVENHDLAFVLEFPMIEGSDVMTKAEHCCVEEFGIDPVYFGLHKLPVSTQNKLVGVHFQGTCLPGSTNPEEELAKQIWTDLLEACYVPIDLHFLHVFHNPVNELYPWATRNCRDLPPSFKCLQMLIAKCMAVVGVASGPFVIAAATVPEKTVFLQKHHTANCYLRDFKNVIDIKNYKKENLLGILKEIEKNG